jgi:hypothetical protein
MKAIRRLNDMFLASKEFAIFVDYASYLICVMRIYRFS